MGASGGRGRGGHEAGGPAHGDFAPWNLLQVADDGWALIDWEDATRSALPFQDPFHWLVQSSAFLGRPSRSEILAGLEGAGAIGRALDAYAAEAGLAGVDRVAAFASYLVASIDAISPSARRREVDTRVRLREALRRRTAGRPGYEGLRAGGRDEPGETGRDEPGETRRDEPGETRREDRPAGEAPRRRGGAPALRLPSLGAMARGAARDHRVIAGVVDAGMSSLATFIVGFHATRSLDPQSLGGYALAFSVFVLSGFVPAQLIFTPTEIAAVTYPRGRQLLLLRESLLRGSLVSAVAALVTSAWFLVAPGGIPEGALVAFVVTCAAATFISPIQDHFRRMLHVAHASWRAVIVALVQIVAVLVAVVAGPRLGVAPAWLPFGALALANVVSLTLGLALSAREVSGALGTETLERERVLRSGRPLLAVGLIPSATTFIVSWLVSALAGAATLGFVEAGRIVSQPVAVLQVGLGNVLGPRATRAASERDRAAGRAVNIRFRVLVVCAGLAWLALVAVPAPWNPLPGVLPTAYVVPGLVAASIAAFTIQSLAQGQRFELYGASRERQVAQAEAEGNAVRVALAFAAGPLGAFVVPLGNTALGLVRLARSHQWLAAHYAGAAPRPPVAEPGTSPRDA